MKKIKIEIKSRWTGNVLFEYEKDDNTIKDTVEQAILEGANLEGAYLYFWDNSELDINEVINDIEENSSIRIKSHYINKYILSPYYLTFWENGLIIDEYEIVEHQKEVKKMTVSEICKELGYEVEIIKEEQ